MCIAMLPHAHDKSHASNVFSVARWLKPARNDLENLSLFAYVRACVHLLLTLRGSGAEVILTRETPPASRETREVQRWQANHRVQSSRLSLPYRTKWANPELSWPM